jgi:uridine kinase
MFTHPFNINGLNNTKKLLHSKQAKIHILGGAGSGKTTIAKRLSVRLSIPHYDLDDIYWNPAKEKYIKQPACLRDQQLAQAVEENAWIIEGVYWTWTAIVFDASDIIIFLDVPLWLRQARVIKRYFRNKINNGWRNRQTLKCTYTILMENFDYERSKIDIQKHLLRHKQKVITCQCLKELEKLLSL